MLTVDVMEIASMDVFLPEDLEAEKFVIGCAVLAPASEARRAFGKLDGSMFSDDYHGWLWERLSWACRRERINWGQEDNGALIGWLVKDGCKERARRYGGTLIYDIYRFTRPVLWHNIHWYAHRVIQAYKRRAGISEAAVHLERLVKEAREYRV